MSSENQNQIDRIFEQAIQLDRADQKAFLDEVCTDIDEGVRTKIEALLDADQSMQSQTDLFEQPVHMNVAQMLPSSVHDELIGCEIGHFQIKKKIASGGFGSVYLGIRDDEIQQKVAVKVLRADHGENESVLRRFEMERQVLSDLDHPFIARLIDGGSHTDGRPYFVMEYIDGQPITEYCCSHSLDLNDRLKLFQSVCRAVSHAHQFSVVHRDIKPSNILVTADGTPKLLDFGIAKLTDLRTQRRMIAITETGQLPMTPDYASPEQLLGNPIRQSTDVYSLGIVLYEILTGKRPYSVDLRFRHHFVQVVCNEEPQKPSTSIFKAQDRTDVDVRRMRRRLAGDLDNIVMMALRKEPDRRYQSANEFADDIQHYFDGLPVTARRDSRTYRTTKFVKRNPGLVFGICSCIVALLVTSIGVSLGWRKANRTATELRRSLYQSEMVSAYTHWQSGNGRIVGDLLRKQIPGKGEADFRQFEWQLLSSLYRDNQATKFNLPAFDFSHAHFQADEESLLVRNENSIHKINLQTGRKTTFPINLGDDRGNLPSYVTYDPTGNNVALVWSESNQQYVEIISLESGNRTRIPSEELITCSAFSADGKLFAFGTDDGEINVANASDGSIQWTPREKKGAYCLGVQFSPDGHLLVASFYGKHELNVWNMIASEDQPERRAFPCEEQIRCFAISHDNRRIAIGADYSLSLLDIRGDLTNVIKLPADSAELVRCVAFSPDGDRIAYGTLAKSFQVRDLHTLQPIFRGSHTENVEQISFSPNSDRVLTISRNEVRQWQMDGPRSESYHGSGAGWNDVGGIQLEAEQTILVVDGEKVMRWELDSNRQTELVTHHSKDSADAIRALAYSPVQNLFATIKRGTNAINVWDSKTGKLHQTCIIPGQLLKLTALAFSPDGMSLVVGGNKYLAIWDVSENEMKWESPVFADQWSNACMFSKDGKYLISAGGIWESSGHVHLWDVQSSMETPTRSFDLPSMATSIDISSNNVLAVADQSGVISLFDLNEMKSIAELLGHSTAVSTIRFHPNGRRLISGGWDRSLNVWNLETASTIGTIRYPANLSSLRFVTNPQNELGLYVASDSDGKKVEINWFSTDFEHLSGTLKESN